MTKPYTVLIVVDYDEPLSEDMQKVLEHNLKRTAQTCLPLRSEGRVLYSEVSDGVTTSAQQPPQPNQPIFNPEWIDGAKRLLSMAELFIKGKP